jgi:hypothetical protein
MSRSSLVDLARVEEEGDQGRILTVLSAMVDISLLKDFKFMLCKAYRQTPIFRHPFFRKHCFSLKYSLVRPPQNFWRYVSIRNVFDNEVQFTILTVQGPLKKLLSVGIEVTSTLPNSDTQKDLLM